MTLDDILLPLHARFGSTVAEVLLATVAAITFESVLLVGAVEVTLEAVVLTTVGMTVLFAVLVVAVIGAHAASAMRLIAITIIKIFFRYISFLQFSW